MSDSLERFRNVERTYHQMDDPHSDEPRYVCSYYECMSKVCCYDYIRCSISLLLLAFAGESGEDS